MLRCATVLFSFFAFFTGAPLALGQAAPTPQRLSLSGDIENYRPISAHERVKWVALGTVGPESLMGGLISSGWGTLFNSPREYGPHWEGFGKRYGMRLTGVSTGNTMEAGFGAMWGEDPRYFRAVGHPFKNRVAHVILSTFLAYDRQGHPMPAYARYVAIPGNNFLSNTWRADSEADVSHALERTLTGFLGKMASNAWAEFWPDVRQHVFKRKKADSDSNRYSSVSSGR